MLLVGGELSVDWLVEAYRRGIFPWPIAIGQGMILAWFSPDPRAIVELDRLHVSRRLARRLRSGRYRVTCNADFPAVIAACAAPRDDSDDERGGSWITPEMLRAYCDLHGCGCAHSVEVWRDDELVGGVYGVATGGAFSAESMFHRDTDASKIALAALVARLRERGFTLLDIQQSSPHMTRMGATEIRRHDFLRRLRKARNTRVSFAG